MKRTILICAILCPFLLAAQPRIKEKKYPSLLWEISGKGLKGVSYLFGTMHVSSKVAFHLADSFYIGIQRADIVALETNPESWQEDMNKYDLGEGSYSSPRYSGSIPNMYFQKSSLQFSRYITALEAALSSNPSSINNLLYRSYGNESSDFEEDTFLDMYIYQCGKKWGKKVAGVERYGESMRLMAEAYRDASKDKNRRPQRYDGDDDYSGSRLQEAYRSGNLDWLDSINKYNSQSDAFDEKFMYRRNEIQANSIDSILRTGQSLFVGVGASHLPGNRGVIELLRKMGYKLRPVKIGARDSDHKTQVEKLRVPVQFNTQYAEDSFFRADIPGKLYPAGDGTNTTGQQYADMSNGSYYIVSRIETNSWMWGHSLQRVREITDSLLYENIPGRIIKKTAITRDGYPGIEIVNRTRRGDMQRYNIYFTPFEILLFKMSGTAEYVTQGTEANRFFSSIRLKNFPHPNGAAWKSFTPRHGGFTVNFPHEPFAADRERWIFDATDPETNSNYRVIRNDIHNYNFTDQDSFDLSMMDESFGSSEFIDKKISGSYSYPNGYPAYDAKYRDKSGATYLVRFLIQGPHYYTVLARSDKDSPRQQEFINSFRVTPFIYGPPTAEKDTALSFTVRTTYIDRPLKEKIDVMGYDLNAGDDDPGTEDGSISRMRVVANDSTGEMIVVNYARMSDYETLKDSAMLKEFSRSAWMIDSSRIVRSSSSGDLPGKGKFVDVVLSDTGSSRIIHMKIMFVSGHAFFLLNEGDTLSGPSSFVKSFFDTFQPADSLKGPDPYATKTERFFREFFNADTIQHKKAVKGLSQLTFTDSDLDSLSKAITTLSYQEMTYLELKNSLIEKLSDLQSAQSTDFLRQLYHATSDTLSLQYTILENLLEQKTDYSFRTFRDIVVADPPVISEQKRSASGYDYIEVAPSYSLTFDESFLKGLGDSLELSVKILPDLLPLMNLEDYEPRIRKLLAVLVDSNLIKPKVYSSWYPRFMLQAKQQLKKQQIDEKQNQIVRAEISKDPDLVKQMDQYTSEDYSAGPASDELAVFATVLLPFYDQQEPVRNFISQLFAGHDESLKYELLLKMISHQKPYPDTMLTHFASQDKRRYDLYSWLVDAGRTDLFPPAQKTQVALAKSYLLQGAGRTPDSLVYLGKLPAKVKGREGMVLFFKYKASKDDIAWTIGNVGLLPTDTSLIAFTEKAPAVLSFGDYDSHSGYRTNPYELSRLGTTRINEELPIDDQLKKELKKILFSTHKSGRMFYYGQKEGEVDEEDLIEVAVPDSSKLRQVNPSGLIR
ncbi:MAG: TraB/GumN family protein [Chitinophagaceae bacterium]